MCSFVYSSLPLLQRPLKGLSAYKQGVTYEIYHDELLNAELEAVNLECESLYSVEEEMPDQE